MMDFFLLKNEIWMMRILFFCHFGEAEITYGKQLTVWLQQMQFLLRRNDKFYE